jgi:hypothetical protein
MLKKANLILWILIIYILYPSLGFAQENTKLTALFNSYNWELTKVEPNIDLQKHTRYTLKEKGLTIYIYIRANQTINKQDIERLMPYKKIFDSFTTLVAESETFFINSSQDIIAIYNPKSWDYKHAQFTNYAQRGLILIHKPDGIYYSFRIINDDSISAVVYGKYHNEEDLNINFLNVIVQNFGMDGALFKKKTSSSLKLWVGTGSLVSLAYEQSLYKGLTMALSFGFTKNIDGLIDTDAIDDGGKNATSMQIGLRFSYYYPNSSSITPYFFLADIFSITLSKATDITSSTNDLETVKNKKMNNLFQMGFGALLTQWIFIEASYSVNMITGDNASNLGMGLRIPF